MIFVQKEADGDFKEIGHAKKHGYKEEDRVEAFRIECQKTVGMAKMSYLTKLGNKVNKPGTSQKFYWKIINRVINRCRAPKIPPLFINNQFILDCKKKHSTFKVVLCLKWYDSVVGRRAEGPDGCSRWSVAGGL